MEIFLKALLSQGPVVLVCAAWILYMREQVKEEKAVTRAEREANKELMKIISKHTLAVQELSTNLLLLSERINAK